MFKSEFIVKVVDAFKNSENGKVMIATDSEIYYLQKDYWNEKTYYYCEELNIIKPQFLNLIEFSNHIFTLLNGKDINVLGVYC